MSKRVLFLSAVLLAAVLLPVRSYGEKRVMAGEKVIVRYDARLEGAAKEVLKLYPAVRTDLTKDLGRQPEYRPEIVLIRDHASFREAAGSDLITAVAIPGQDLVVIDYSRMGEHPFTLGVTLKHELCHLDLHHRIPGGKLPRWLDEGICQWVTGGFAEIISDRGRSVLGEAVLSKRLISIDRLTAGFPSGGRELVLAYEESRSIVEFMEREFGAEALLRLLDELAVADDLDQAVRDSLALSLDELEKRWRSSLSAKKEWLFFVRDYLYEILFTAAAGITVCGFFRFLKRKREYRDEDEEGEYEEDEEEQEDEPYGGSEDGPEDEDGQRR